MSTRLETRDLHYATFLVTSGGFKLIDAVLVDPDLVQFIFESQIPGINLNNHYLSWASDSYVAPPRALLRNYAFLRSLIEEKRREAKDRHAD